MVPNTNTGVSYQFLSYFDGFPENSVAIAAYFLGVLLVLLAWYFITKPYPKFCFISTLILFALIGTPAVSEGSNATIAPAICAVLFGTLTHDYPLVFINLSSMLFIISLGMVVGFCWIKFLSIRKPIT